MVSALSTTLTFVALGAGGWALILLIANRPVLPNRWFGLGLLGVLALLELGLLVQAAIGFVELFTTERDLSGLTFAGYLLACLVVVPLAAFWALGERSRWGAGVLLVGCLAIPVLIVRLGQVWNGHA
jgi:hypothetical protein